MRYSNLSVLMEVWLSASHEKWASHLPEPPMGRCHPQSHQTAARLSVWVCSQTSQLVPEHFSLEEFSPRRCVSLRSPPPIVRIFQALRSFYGGPAKVRRVRPPNCSQ